MYRGRLRLDKEHSVYELANIMGMDTPIGLLVEPEETLKFIDFLPDIKWYQGYVVLMLIRTKGLKEKYGFKGSDHSLSLHVVHGYTMFPKLKLLQMIRKLSIQGYYSETIYTYYRHIGGGEVEAYTIPSQLITIQVSPNPSNWIRAGLTTLKEFMESLYSAMFNPERADEIIRRIDTRYHSNNMRYTETYFHMIDVDDQSLIPEVEQLVQEHLGYLPARIVTRRGEHILVPVKEFTKQQAREWFLKVPRKINDLNKDYEEPMVEYKKNFQEPVPGVLYKEIVPRFKPPEK